MNVLDDLLELQRLDTEDNQLRHRREVVPEHEQVRTAHAALTAWERQRTGIRTQLDELARNIRSEEAAAADLDANLERLERQLKTVIATREAEALMQEISTLRAKRDALDDAELEHLERQEQLESDLADLLGQEESLRHAGTQADEALARALADIDSELSTLDEQRSAQRGGLPAQVLSRYDQLRASLDGVAIARLNGSRCDGCHLDMSAAELDAVKATPPGEAPECPNCGRLLVR